MNFLKKIPPEWPLRIGLGMMFLYSGYDIAFHPTSWHWVIQSLPQIVQTSINAIGIDTYLRFQGGGELVLAVLLLAWFLPRRVVFWAALLTAVEMAAILALAGVDQITFRDIGLLGAAISLLIILYNNHGTKR